MTCILITREQQDSERFAALLNVDAAHYLIYPLWQIEHKAVTMPITATHIILTSHHALKAISNAMLHKSVHFFVIGMIVENQLRLLGYNNIHTFQTALEMLDALKKVQASQIIYIRGADISLDFKTILKSHIYIYEVIAYELQFVETNHIDLQTLLTSVGGEHATIILPLFSARTALRTLEFFKEKMPRALLDFHVIAMSTTIAEIAKPFQLKNISLSVSADLQSMADATMMAYQNITT